MLGTAFENRGVSISDRGDRLDGSRVDGALPLRESEPFGDGGAATVHPLAGGEPPSILKAGQFSAPTINLPQ